MKQIISDLELVFIGILFGLVIAGVWAAFQKQQQINDMEVEYELVEYSNENE